MLVGIRQFLALVLAGQCVQEGLDLLHIGFRHGTTYLVFRHHLNGLLQCRNTAVMIVRPGQRDIAQRRCLETVTVALHLCLCPTAVVSIGQTGFLVDLTVLELVGPLSHQLV